jgi:hypothetical protein
MLAKCSNPCCSVPFLRLAEGRLFRLETDPVDRPSTSSQTEYFWLCPRCSSAMTLRLREDARVETVPFPEAMLGVSDGVARASADGKQGQLLRTVSPCPTERIGNPARLKDGYRAA